MTKGKKTTIKKQKAAIQLRALTWPVSEKQTFWLFAGMITILTGIIYAGYLFGPDLFIFSDVGSDTITMFYPNLVGASRYFQEAGFPGWSFYVGLGGNTYPAFLNSPFQLVYLPMNAVTIAYSIAWVQAAIMIGTGLIFYRFLREAQFTLPVCIIGGVIYTFGGYLVIGSSWYGHSHAIFWITLALLGFELLLRKKNWWVFIIPFVALLGARSYFLILFFTIYAAVRILDHYGYSWREILGGYKRLFLCGIAALLLSLPFIGGEWHRFKYSPRVSGDVSYSEQLSKRSKFHIANQEHLLTAFFRTISNDGVGTGSDFKGWKNYLEAPAFYMGILAILLVFQFFALTTPRRRLIYGLFLGFWIFLILFPWFRYAFYGFAGNYYKGALSLFIPFSFLFVALMGLQEIVSGKKVNLPVLIASFLALLIFMWIPYDEPEIKISQTVLLKASVFTIAYLFILGCVWAGAGKRSILFILLAFVLTEAALFSWPALNDRIAITKADIQNKKFHFDYSIEAADYIKDQDKDPFYRVDKVFGSVKSGFNDGMVQGYFGSKMYQSHNHKNYVRFLTEMEMINGSVEANTRWLLGLAFNHLLHPLFSIKYVLSNDSTLHKVDDIIYTKIHQTGDVAIHRNNYFIPFGIPFDHFVDYDDFTSLDSRTKRLVLFEGVVLEDYFSAGSNLIKWDIDSVADLAVDVNEQLKTLPKKAMKMEFFNHKRIKGSIDINKPSVIFFSIPFDIGWKAKVDHVPTDLWQVDIGFTGLPVEPGEHSIELVYEPPLSKWGWLGWAGAIVVGFLVYRFRKGFWSAPNP